LKALGLLVADGRFPAGGHAHSGGVEPAVADGRVTDEETLGAFLAGRLATAGRVAAGLAAAACAGGSPVALLDREASARMASPAVRQASRTQGRQLLRAARSVLGIAVESDELHHAVAIGVVSQAAGLTPVEAARWAAYESITGPAAAAVRLLGLDPFRAWQAVADLAAEVDALAEAAPRWPTLPACSAPLLDIGAERHAVQEVRLFAS